MLLVDGDVEGVSQAPMRLDELEELDAVRPTLIGAPPGWTEGDGAPEPAAARRRGLARFFAKLALAVLVFTVAVTLLPFGRPDSSLVVTTPPPTRPLGALAAPVAEEEAESTTPDDSALADRGADAAADGATDLPGSAPMPFVIDVAALGPEIYDAQLAASVAAGEWIEPVIEAEERWADAGNGVRLPDLLLRVRFCESTNNYRAANGSSSARGAYQFLTKSWEWYGHAERYGVGGAHLATPAQQDEAALLTYRQVGLRPWAESRHCWDSDDIDPSYATAPPPATAPPAATSTTNAPPATEPTITVAESTTTTQPSDTTESTVEAATTSTTSSTTP